jgi:hypothetical protein
MFYFVATGDNTGAVTLNIDSLGAKAVTRDGSVALAAGDIKSGEVVVVVYDGTRFQVVSQLNSAGNATFANVSITSALNVGGVATFSAGTAAAPSITTTGDTNTGIFFPAADTIAFAEGGVEAARFDSSGNLGIGTSSPGSKLEIRNDVLATTSLDTTAIKLYNNLDGGSGIEFSNSVAAKSKISFGVTSTGAGTDDSYLGFSTCANAGALTERARITSAGDLLVGATTGSGAGEILSVVGGNNIVARFKGSGAGLAALDVVNNADQLGVQCGVYSSSYSGGSNFNVGANGGFVASNSGAPLAIGTIGSQPLILGTVNTERARIDSSGNLGIGTSSPAAKLHVDSGATDEVARFNSTGNPYISVHDSDVRQFYIQSLASDVDFVVEANKALSFYTNNTKRVSITAAGSVVTGNGALATTATDGFLYVPTCAGTPTGTPTTITGMAPIVVNTTNNKLYFYSGGAWRDAGP